MSSRVKQVIVIRKDLGMRKGKMVAQGCHASIGALEAVEDLLTDSHCSDCTVLDIWEADGSTKVCVYVSSDDELIGVFGSALNVGIPAFMVTDLGRTEFDGVMTRTAVAIGPWFSDQIDAITGALPLL